MGGFFSTILNVAGSAVGDPGLGNQVASQSPAAFGTITQTPDQIAAQVLPKVKATLSTGTPSAKDITPASQQIATLVAPDIAAQLAADGVMFPAGTVGANLQHPTVLNAFGGQNAQWVLVGGLALAALLLFKEI